MRTSLRALLSVVMLVGFYVFAFGLVVALCAFGFQAGTDRDGNGTLTFRPFVVGGAIVLLAALVAALGKVLTARPASPTGIRLTPERAPQLWTLVQELAARAETRPPDEIRLVAEANAGVSEDSRLLGLVPGWRTLVIGMPLLRSYTVDQLRAVLAHEMGHYSGRHTATARLAHRGRMVVVETVQHTTDGLLRAVLSGYARLYVGVEQGVSRQLEFEADRAAVASAGREAMVSALRETRVVGTAWDAYLERHLLPAYDRGHLPEDVFGGFDAFLAECRAELTGRSVEVAPAEPAWWESHPPIGARIAALRFVPDVSVRADGRPATVLVPELAAASRQLQAGVFDRAGIRLLPWDQLTPTLADQAARGLAHPLFQAATRLTGRAHAGLDLLLDLFAADRYADLARALAPDAGGEDGLRELTAAFEGAVEAAAVESGAAAWRHSWSGPPELLTRAGEPLPLDELVELAADPLTVPAARERLAVLGIRVSAEPASPAPA
ncbi:M48 family metallopeptidase [Micromonospora sp. 4G57]|uniref:M48 family metallopeptidase n=1 Tax=Micromonospora sicca TaxID=2202420 RepID=A0ABU5JKJ0_9ACTN|nr:MULTISPECIES: M48 family metallopeptidase [unclassified Micromonospora]MDZ5447821.1 M48 family metallopeptidase [Micromonospora sp. 4G57]MDZ5493133.1 M48 family metallopeptidase [Micromonospora sp. 4G53]